MSYNVIAVPKFVKNLKKLLKKHPSLKSEFVNLISSLENDPTQGTNLGNNCYKIRLAIKSKSKGKSGGARIITNVVILKTTVYLLAIYDKSEKANLSNKELIELLNSISE